MRRMLGLSMVMCSSLLALPAIAQDDGGNVALIHCLDVKQGAQDSFEAAMTKHMKWHREQKDSWSWVVWTVTTGPDTGRSCAGTFDHKWEDFDAPDVSAEADGANVMATFGPFIENHEAAYWTRLAEVSRPADAPTPMSSVIFFHVRFGMDEEFNYLIGEFHKAIDKTEMPWRYQWNALVSGGDTGTYALVLPLADFAAFSPTGKPFNQMLEDAFGRQTADTLLASWRQVVKRSESRLIQGRPDLSYIPAP